MKKHIILFLLFHIIFFVSCKPINSESESDNKRYFNQTDISPEGWCVNHGVYYNFYEDSPDIPPVGCLKLTNLAAYLANTSDADEEMFFLVGVTADSSVSRDATSTKSLTEEDFMKFEYNGKTVEEYLSEFEYAKYCKNNSKELTESWYILLDNLNSGMNAEEALKEEKYAEISDMYFKYKVAYHKAFAAYICQYSSIEAKPSSAEYLESFGIELCTAPNTEDWQYHLQVIMSSDSRIGMINGSMDYLVRCTAEELWSLYDGNTKYGFIFYASDSEGRYIVSNKRPSETFRGNYPTDLCFFDRTIIDGHVAFSYEELGLYNRLN